MTDSVASKRGVLHSPAGPLLWSLLFLALFLGVFFLQKPSILVIENDLIKRIFSSYAVAVGPALALLALLAWYILAGVKRLIGLRKFRILNPIIALVIFAPLAAFGWELLYREKPYTDIARGIIGLLAAPLFYSSLVACGLAILWLIVVILRRR